jgi:hypothetical protein
MKSLALLLGAFFLIGCGGGSSSAGGGTPVVTPPVVHAAGFTNASISGGYAFGISGTAVNSPEAGSGVVTADGNGNITSGEETVNIGGISCHATLTGTYSVNANGTGIATVTATPDAASVAKGCIGGTGDLSLAIANGGAGLILASQNANSTTVATAAKQ